MTGTLIKNREIENMQLASRTDLFWCQCPGTGGGVSPRGRGGSPPLALCPRARAGRLFPTAARFLRFLPSAGVQAEARLSRLGKRLGCA